MILSSLLYMFEADTKGLDKGIKQSERGADKLTEALKRGERQAKKTNLSFATMAKGLIGWLGAAVSVSKVMGMAVARAGEIDALDALSEKLGTSITQTDALARSITALGGSTKQAQSDLGRLADGLLKQGIEPMEGMLSLSDRLAKMSYGQAAAELKKFGIVERSTIDLMRKGRFEMERATKEQIRNGAITEESAAKARAFNDSLGKLRTVIADAASSVLDRLMPALTWIVDLFAKAGKWAQDNEHFVIAFFAGVAAVVAAVFVPAMWSAAAATLAATWPFILIGALIAGVIALFALIYDDIQNFREGNESMIGSLMEKYPRLAKTFEVWQKVAEKVFALVGKVIGAFQDIAVAAFEWVAKAGGELWDSLDISMDDIIDGLDNLGEMFDSYFDTIGKVADKLGEWLGAAFDGIGTIFDKAVEAAKEMGKLIGKAFDGVTDAGQWLLDAMGAMANGIVGVFQWLWDTLGRILGLITAGIEGVKGVAKWVGKKIGIVSDDDDVADATADAQAHLTEAAGSKAAQYTTGSIRSKAAAESQHNETNVAIGEVKVETQATDAQGMARDTGDALKDALSNVAAENSTAMAR